jgi:hypothetical protein
MGIVKKQVNVIAELTSLFHWYQQIRIACVAKTSQQKFIYESGLRIVKSNLKERLFQLQRFMDAIANSHSLTIKTKSVSKKEFAEQIHLLGRWSHIQKRLVEPAHFELTVPNLLTDNIGEQQAKGETVYTKLIQNLSQPGIQAGKQWLKSITENVRNVFVDEMMKGE